MKYKVVVVVAVVAVVSNYESKICRRGCLKKGDAKKLTSSFDYYY
jgi:hypothetical protein